MRALLLVLMLSACIHRVGETCRTDDAHCADPHTKLVCGPAGLLAVPCPGPNGCALDVGRTVLCDQSEGAKFGEKCLPAYAGKGQCSGPVMLQCTGGSWVQVACPEGMACTQDEGNVICK